MRQTLLVKNKGFLDFSPCDAGMENCDPSHKFGPFIRNYYLIHFVVSGKGTFETARGIHSLEKRKAFLIKPGEVTVYQADEVDPWEYLWIGFRGKSAERFSELSDTFEYDESLLPEIYNAFKNEKSREELIMSVMFKLYAQLFCEGDMSEDYPGKVANYINSHYMEDVTIASIASALRLNRKYLARIFKEKNGVSMQEFLINKRLHEAKKLLKLGHTVEESAYLVGYSDPFGFSKAFKKRYGVSPCSFKLK